MTIPLTWYAGLLVAFSAGAVVDTASPLAWLFATVGAAALVLVDDFADSVGGDA